MGSGAAALDRLEVKGERLKSQVFDAEQVWKSEVGSIRFEPSISLRSEEVEEALRRLARLAAELGTGKNILPLQRVLALLLSVTLLETLGVEPRLSRIEEVLEKIGVFRELFGSKTTLFRTVRKAVELGYVREQGDNLTLSPEKAKMLKETIDACMSIISRRFNLNGDEKK